MSKIQAHFSSEKSAASEAALRAAWRGRFSKMATSAKTTQMATYACVIHDPAPTELNAIFQRGNYKDIAPTELADAIFKHAP
jgi:hypothetical protein